MARNAADRDAADRDAADIQNLRSYYTEGQAFFRSTEASNLNSYNTRGYTVLATAARWVLFCEENLFDYITY